MSGRVRVLLADDQPLIRTGLRVVIADAPDLEVVAEAGTGAEAVRLARELGPDVVVMDIRMPGMDGIEATRLITQEAAAPHVLMLTTFDEDEYVYASLRAGASGFLVKDMALDDILGAVRVVAAGDALIAPSVTRRLIRRHQHAVARRGRGAPDLGRRGRRGARVRTAAGTDRPGHRTPSRSAPGPQRARDQQYRAAGFVDRLPHRRRVRRFPGAGHFAVDLDSPLPKATPVSGVQGDTKIPAGDFPYQVSATDPQVIDVDATASDRAVSWYVDLTWSSGSQHGTYRIDDRGRPFRTAGTGNLACYQYAIGATRWLPCAH